MSEPGPESVTTPPTLARDERAGILTLGLKKRSLSETRGQLTVEFVPQGVPSTKEPVSVSVKNLFTARWGRVAPFHRGGLFATPYSIAKCCNGSENNVAARTDNGAPRQCPLFNRSPP